MTAEQSQAIVSAAQGVVSASQSYLASLATPSNAQIAAIDGMINAANAIIKNTSTLTSTITINVNGASLERLAAQYYGDYTQWRVIAQANGLSSPWAPSGIITALIIPLTFNLN